MSALLLLFTAPAQAERRVGLVIGIDRYQHLPPLEKAVADARAVAKVLQGSLGFATVLTLENPDRRQMSRKLAELDGTIQPGDTVFFFYSGHGVALGADNILLPADMPRPSQGQDGMVRDDGFAVDGIVRRMQGRGAKVSILVLDACRDNPFDQVGTRNMGAMRGLTRIDAPQGVFVLFSAGLGQKALDRLPGNDPVATSVFTRHLIPALLTPGLSHVQIAKRVQQEVNTVALRVAHAQQPAYYDQIVGDVVLLDDTARKRAEAEAAEEARRREEAARRAEQERRAQEEAARKVEADREAQRQAAAALAAANEARRQAEAAQRAEQERKAQEDSVRKAEAEREAQRLAGEAEAARKRAAEAAAALAAANEARRQTDSGTAAEQEQQATRRAAEQEARRQAAEVDAARRAKQSETERVKREAEAKRRARLVAAADAQRAGREKSENQLKQNVAKAGQPKGKNCGSALAYSWKVWSFGTISSSSKEIPGCGTLSCSVVPGARMCSWL